MTDRQDRANDARFSFREFATENPATRSDLRPHATLTEAEWRESSNMPAVVFAGALDVPHNAFPAPDPCVFNPLATGTP